MIAFDLEQEKVFDPARHVEKILGTESEGDFTVACWEPGQISPDHCHPDATEIYFCFSGGGTMRAGDQVIEVKPGAFVVHPPGEVHEYANGPERSLLFRVRYGGDMAPRMTAWRGNDAWTPTAEDIAYFVANPVA